MAVSIRIDTREFNATLQRYLAASKKTLPEVLNQKAFSILTSAIGFTQKAQAPKIRASLNRIVPDKRGGHAPLAALIVQSKRGTAGEKGLYGADMREAVKTFINKKIAAIRFLSLGWIPAATKFGVAIGKRPSDKLVSISKRFEKDGAKGGGEIARAGFTPKAHFFNLAFSKQHPGGGVNITEAGLRKAIALQVKDMNIYIERKMQEMTNRVVGRIFR